VAEKKKTKTPEGWWSTSIIEMQPGMGLAHAWEESQSGERNKGPIPRHLLWQYQGPSARPMKKKRRS